MIQTLLAALRAIPLIVDALNRLTDATIAVAASARRKEKDETIDRLIAAARRRRGARVSQSKAEWVSGGGGI